MKVQNSVMLRDREIRFYTTVSDPSWGYKKEQKDTFVIQFPKDYDSNKKYPLYVVFHSAGHDVFSTLTCLKTKGNHDIYHTPDDMFGLFLDCFAHSDGDWWWGGIGAICEDDPDRRGIEKQPVENRCIATIEWAIENYNIDKERVYAVGNSMGGSGALGICLCRGDLFAAVKVNVPAGVRHVAERCCFNSDAPEGFTIPDPPVVVDYSAQNDEWSTGHEVLYESMRRKKYALHGYWGEFGHGNNNVQIAEHNDLIHAIPVLELKLHEAYPVFTDATTDDRNPWENKDSFDRAGQVNGFFKWENISDTEDLFEIKLWLITPSEWQTRVSLPEKSEADLLMRRVQRFKLAPHEEFSWTLTAEDGDSVSGSSFADKDGYITIEKIAVLQKKQTLTVKRM